MRRVLVERRRRARISADHARRDLRHYASVSESGSSSEDQVFELPAIYRYGSVALAIFIGAIAVIFATSWASGRSSDYPLTAFLLLFSVAIAVWPFRNRISLTESTLVDMNMRKRVIPYRDIRSAEVRNLRYDVVVLTLNSGKELSLGSSVGRRVNEIAAAINGRLKNPRA